MRILYTTDGSEGALAGAHLLAQLPLEADAELTILTVVPDHEKVDVEAAQAALREVLRSTPASISSEVRRGHIAEEILRATEAHPTDLVVVGSRGLSGLRRFFLGSVAERVMRHAPCPVLLARPLVNNLREVILGTDGSQHAGRAEAWLQRFPLPDDCEVRIVTVMPFLEAISPSRKLAWPAEFRVLYQQECEEARRHLDALVTAFTLRGRKSVADLRSGDPAHSLIEVTEEEKADLIVLGACGLTAIERFLLGHVCEKVLRYAHCSVLVVR